MSDFWCEKRQKLSSGEMVDGRHLHFTTWSLRYRACDGRLTQIIEEADHE